MKLAQGQQSNVLESNALSESSAFKIARTPHMFNILSSGLYSDKIRAVLREIGCNAMDAHIMNGTPERPILVKLPSTFDKTFFIQDWGPGLSHEEIIGMYTVYGWSNKQNSDEVTGAFGLGSKSPFAYTLQTKENSTGFTVESVKNGIKRIYSCFINEEGSPEVGLLFETKEIDPSWTHGLKVSFSVQEKDIAEFQSKAQSVFKWFKVPPQFQGANFTLGKEKQSYKYWSSTYALPVSAGAYDSCVIMGNVRYPIDVRSINSSQKFTPIEQYLIDNGIVLFLEMGSVMMTPSREHLEYTPKTIKGVREALAKAAQEYAQTCLAFLNLKAVSSWGEAQKTKLFSDYFIGYSFKSYLKNFQEAFKDYIPDPVDQKAIFDKINRNSISMPSWVGNSRVVEDPMTKLPLINQIVVDMKDASPDFLQKAQKAQQDQLDVWYFQFHERGNKASAVKRKILSGKIYSADGTATAVAHPLTKNLVVYYMDGSISLSEAQQLVRFDIVNKKDTEAAILVGKKPSEIDAKEALLYAKAIAGEEGFGGIEFKNVSELKKAPEVLASLANIAKAPKAVRMKKKDDPRVFWAQEEVVVLTRLPAGHSDYIGFKVSTAKLGDLTLPEEMLYVVNNPLGSKAVSDLRAVNKPYEELDQNENSIKAVSAYDFKNSMRSISNLCYQLGFDIKKIVVLKSPAVVKRYRMQDQGFSGLFTKINQILENPVSQKAISEAIVRNKEFLKKPEIDFSYTYRASNTSSATPLLFWGILKEGYPEAWAKFKTVSHFKPFVKTIEEKVNFFKEKPTSKKKDCLDPLFNSFLEVLDSASYSLRGPSIEAMIKFKDSTEVQLGLNWEQSNKEVFDMFKNWDYLNYSKVVTSFVSIKDSDENLQNFVDFLDMFYVGEQLNLLSYLPTVELEV